MASDLSTIVKEILSSTLETTISKKTDVSSTNNISKEYFADKNIVSVDASFAYEQLTSNIKVIIPAQTASFIFNCMMMEEGPLSDEINDDTADAVKEVVSQISGGMETAINGEAFEDLGSTKFSIGEFAILSGKDYQVVNSLILFNLNIEDQTFEFYMDFDEATLPYIEELKNSETIESESVDPLEGDDELSELLESDEDTPTENSDSTEEELSEVPSDETTNEETSDEELEELEEVQETEETSENNDDSKEESSDENTSDETIPEDQEGENISDDEEPSDEDKKNKKLKLIIYIVAGLLASVIIGFLVAYFMGVFDPPPPPPKKEVNATKEAKKSMIIIDVKNKEIDYKDSMINEKRLNKKLALLTKYEILEEDVLAKFQQAEQERLHKLRMERLEEFAKNNKEESLFQKDINNSKNASKMDRFASGDMNNSKFRQAQENEKLTYIEVTPLKYKKYKSIISREKSKSTSISICKNDKGKISVYIGPMYANFEVNNIIKNIKKKDKKSENYVKLISLTKKEFDTMCDF
jgi:hypothetical protein